MAIGATKKKYVFLKKIILFFFELLYFIKIYNKIYFLLELLFKFIIKNRSSKFYCINIIYYYDFYVFLYILSIKNIILYF